MNKHVITTTADATAVAETINKAWRKYGAQCSVPYTNAQLLATISLLHDYIKNEAGKEAAELREKLTFSNRRYAALNARYQKLAGKDSATEEPNAEG